jgi:hypothetical protein
MIKITVSDFCLTLLFKNYSFFIVVCRSRLGLVRLEATDVPLLGESSSPDFGDFNTRTSMATELRFELDEEVEL